jgi:hypothetical protein
MTNTIFRVTVATLVGAMAIAGAFIAAAQSSRTQSWNDLLKPYEAKTNPAGPVALAEPAAPVEPPEISKALKDACIVSALGRLPKIDGQRVTQSSYKFHEQNTELNMTHGIVSVSVEVRGHQGNYTWLCSVSPTVGLQLYAWK